MTLNDQKLKKLALNIGFALLLFYGIFSMFGSAAVAIEAFLGKLIPANTAHIIGQTLYGCFYFLAFSIPAFMLCKLQKNKEEYRPISFSSRLPRYAPLIIIAAIAINYAVSNLNSIIFMPLLPTFNEVAEAETVKGVSAWAQIIMMVFTTAIVPSICEELLFRGAILSNLEPFGRGSAVLFSSLMFGLMHQNLFQIIYTTVLGVVLGLVYVRTRSLWCCVLIHFFNNASAVLQESLELTLDARLADTIVIIMNLAVISVGAASIFFLMKKRAQRPSYEDTGSFGVIYEPNLDYEEYRVTKGKKLKLMFSPTVIIFAALSIASMGSTLLLMITAGTFGA